LTSFSAAQPQFVTPADRAQGMAQANMRQIIERAAKNAGIEIPSLRQTAVAKKALSMPATDEPHGACCR
jgi:hypothetical protein